MLVVVLQMLLSLCRCQPLYCADALLILVALIAQLSTVALLILSTVPRLMLPLNLRAGCGKTSLLNLLAGRTSTATRGVKLAGEILLNGDRRFALLCLGLAL